MVDYSKKENWTIGSLAFSLEHHCVLSAAEKNSFDRLWDAKLKCEEVLGTIIKPSSQERVAEYMKDQEEYHYLNVDHNYKLPVEGKGQKDAVSFFMGVYDTKEIEMLINVPTEDARQFAQAILNICDEIEKEL